MMDTFTVSFFGHRVIENPLAVERRLETLICELLTSHGYVEFLVGRDGDFDQLVSSVIRRCKRTVRADNSSHVWVMPYETAEFRDNEDSFYDYYDEVEVCQSASGGHFKAAGKVQAEAHDFPDRNGAAAQVFQHLRIGFLLEGLPGGIHRFLIRQQHTVLLQKIADGPAQPSEGAPQADRRYTLRR